MTEMLKSKIQNPKSETVLIIGAGPAGSFAAELLARQNVKVILFDGRPAGTAKPCGGGVTAKALKAYPHLLKTVGRAIDELEMFAPSGKRLYLKLDEPFAIYDRAVFDDFLRNRAERAGAFVIKEKAALVAEENGEWILRSSNKNEFRGNFLVAADGANSRLAKKLSGILANSEMEVAFGYRIGFEAERKTITTIAFLRDFAGYAWAFPRTNHFSFGIATTQNNFDYAELDKILWQFIIGFERQRRGEKVSIWQDLKKAENVLIKNELEKKAEKYAARIPGLAAETLNARQTCGKNWALLGDAAGFADAVTGEGIYYALRSAEIFAECFFKKKDYEVAWRADFGRELRRAAQMRHRFYGNFFGAAFTERMIQFARFHGGIRKVLRELVAGEQGYVDLKKVLAKRAFLPF
jgi:geranylgeranyl reductase family protein